MADNDLADYGQRLAAGQWKWVGSSTGGSINLGGFLRGVNPWDYKWESVGVQVQLEEPAYHQLESVSIWRINVGGRWVYFGATELTPGVFGFWRPIG